MTYFKKTPEEEAIGNDWQLIVDRGIQWAYAEENNTHLELDDIDLDDEYYYGQYQENAVKIFNARYPKWHVTITAYDKYNTEHTWDYFAKEPRCCQGRTISLDVEPRLTWGQRIKQMPGMIGFYLREWGWRITHMWRNYRYTKIVKKGNSHPFEVCDATTREQLGIFHLNEMEIDVAKLPCIKDGLALFSDENGMCSDLCPHLDQCPVAKSNEIANFKQNSEFARILAKVNYLHSPAAKVILDHTATARYCRNCDIMNGIYILPNKTCPRCGSTLVHEVRIVIKESPQFTEAQQKHFEDLDTEFMEPL